MVTAFPVVVIELVCVPDAKLTSLFPCVMVQENVPPLAPEAVITLLIPPCVKAVGGVLPEPKNQSVVDEVKLGGGGVTLNVKGPVVATE